MRFLTLLICILIGYSAQARTLELDPARTITIAGVVDGSAIAMANQLDQLSRKSTDPVYLVINSPGGAVLPGLVFLDAMEMAQSRGVTIRCVVPVMAASMAFVIYAKCDQRYSLRRSLLLFHPMKAMVQTALSADDAGYMAWDLRNLERPITKMLIEKLGLDPKVFEYHYRHETLWTAESLLRWSPQFLTIIDDAVGAGQLFPGE